MITITGIGSRVTLIANFWTPWLGCSEEADILMVIIANISNASKQWMPRIIDSLKQDSNGLQAIGSNHRLGMTAEWWMLLTPVEFLTWRLSWAANARSIAAYIIQYRPKKPFVSEKVRQDPTVHVRSYANRRSTTRYWGCHKVYRPRGSVSFDLWSSCSLPYL